MSAKEMKTLKIGGVQYKITDENIGLLENLNTTQKSTIVDAINELVANSNSGIDSEQVNALIQEHLEKNPPAAYTLPIATETTLGGVKAAAATEEMTQPVGITAEGKLVTVPGQNSGGNAELKGDLKTIEISLEFEQGAINKTGDLFDATDTIRTKMFNMKRGTRLKLNRSDIVVSMAIYNKWGALYSGNLVEFKENVTDYVSENNQFVAITIRYVNYDTLTPEVGNDFVSIYDVFAEYYEVENGIYYADEYGCKPNDTSFDNSVPLQLLIDKVNTNGGKILFGKGIYYFEKGVTFNKPVCVSLCGANPYYNNKGTMFKYKGTDTLITVYGADNFSIKNMVFYGADGVSGKDCGTAICFADNSTDTSDCRLDQVIIEDVYFFCFDYDVKIDCPTGYVYFNRCRTQRTGKASFCIGKDYANTVSVLPGYIYFTECNLEGINSEKDAKGIEIHCGQWIWIDKCDICNFGDANNLNNSAGIYIVSDVGYINNIKVTNNSLFNNTNSVMVIRDTRLIKHLKFSNNDHNIGNWGRGYYIYTKTDTSFCHSVIICGENFSKYTTNISNIFAISAVHDLSVSGCVFDYELTLLYKTSYFNNINGRFNKIDLFEKPVNRYTLSANEERTVVISNARSLMQASRPIVVGTDEFTSSWNADDGNTTLVLKNTKNKETVVSVLFMM